MATNKSVATLSEASPVKLAPLIAGKAPVKLAAGIAPVPVMLLLFRSKLPPNCGVVSAARLAIPPASVAQA